jgi:S-adenosylmethionine:tRNA ribosyltransferase-isomerase
LVTGDVLVINETRVIRARLHGVRAGGGKAEVLLLAPSGGGGYDPSERAWLALVRPGRRLGVGAQIHFGDASATIVRVLDDGPRIVEFAPGTDLEALMREYGELPLPPYVGPGDAACAERYQTVFARVPGSVAAPTASLHFTSDLLARIRERGVAIVPLVLDVGIGTFRPMSGTTLDEHVMHAERYAIPPETAAAVNAARSEGRRVIAAGTTVLRALEGAAQLHDPIRPGPGETALFVTPGFAFRVVDALVTNFHLPKSTLLVLVSAFGGGRRVRAAYEHAIREQYRFFSFGDAMLLARDTSDIEN